MLKEALYYEKLNKNMVRCNLCPHNCLIKPDKSGLCLIRKNIDGILYQSSYNEISSISIDPIEKKPLYHFYPGSTILSVGTNGCNLSCDFCQNWQISTQITNRETISVDKLLNMVQKENSIGIAYTYNEPLIWYEFVKDCAKKFKEKRLKNVLVTNGNINEKPLKDLVKYIDAANVDLKGFTNDFYKWVKGDLKTTLETIKILLKEKVHVELTNLVIPTKNDNIEIFKEMCSWIANLDKNIPLHLSRYFPSYNLNIPQTSSKTLSNFYSLAKNYLNYVYVGNIHIEGTVNTYCPECNSLLVRRDVLNIENHLKEKTCPFCKKQLYFVV